MIGGSIACGNVGPASSPNYFIGILSKTGLIHATRTADVSA
jgi:hypothetical protein